MSYAIGNSSKSRWNFSNSEWLGVILAGDISAALSFAGNSCVLIVHGLMTWYRPVIVNRLSLRMIVVSCICNMIYCACQMVSDDISSQAFSCRVIAYLQISSDTMACMCLAMVGLNLVMIFVLKVSRSVKIELIYYLIVAISGILVCIIPEYLGNPKGPKNKREESSCWYHYYFNGRTNNVFNWMWYYGWLLFSSVFAALCAIISIRFVIKKQENFSGTLDMFSRKNQKEIHSMAIIRRYSANNTDIFHKIAVRCICYPLVPLISKSWGVAIEIAATKKVLVPYPIYVLDRIFTCLLGFMVSCIYFTDPAIRAVMCESADNIKRKYVHDYYIVKYQASADSSKSSDPHYPKLLKVVPVTEETNQSTPQFIRDVRERYFTQDMENTELYSTTDPNATTSMSTTAPTASHSIHPEYHRYKPEMPTVQISTSVQDRRFSIVSATSINGGKFLPNEISHIEEQASPGTDPGRSFGFINGKKCKTIPMRRVSETPDTDAAFNKRTRMGFRDNFQMHSGPVETLEPFKYPTAARAIHWTLINIFRVKPVEVHTDDTHMNPSNRQEGTTRVFHDFTDGSEPGTPLQSYQYEGLAKDNVSYFPLRTPDPTNLYTESLNRSDSGLPGSSIAPPRKLSMPEYSNYQSRFLKDKDGSRRLHSGPLRRVSSINVASLQRERDKLAMADANVKSPSQKSKNKLQRSITDHVNTSIDDSNSSSTAKLASTIKLSKMLNRGRSVSFSWSRLTSAKNKASPLPGSLLAADNITSKHGEPSSSADIATATTTAQDEIELESVSTSKMKMKQPITDADDTVVLSIPPPENSYSDYPRALFPRPRSQYKKMPLTKTTDQSLDHTISQSSKDMATYEDGNIDKPQTAVAPNSSRKQKSLSALTEEQDPMAWTSQVSTTLDYISSWSEDNDPDDDSRLTRITQSWDLAQQIQQQLELAKDIEHM